jgi:pantoate--beta-alanine ligase
MLKTLRVVRTIPALRRALGRWRDSGETVALVPTMGALHAGHLSLVRLAQRKADRVVVSVFVNPTQFGPDEDFATYPRTWMRDAAELKKARADLVWAPQNQSMYPSGFATQIVPAGAATVGLEDAFRPHFFAAVATVVSKLFLQCLPDIAVFGEKDFQQLKVIEQTVRDLDVPITILAAPTLREADGLAMSSRNAYLTAKQREMAPTLFQILRTSAKSIRQGRSVSRTLNDARRALTRGGFVLDYFEARNSETLQPLGRNRRERIRLLAAARIGATRLIDNIGV